MSREMSGRASSWVGPANVLIAVTPSDSQPLIKGLPRALFVGVAGKIVVEDSAGNTVEIESQAGQYHPIRVARVLATGTTAENIIAIY